MTKLTNQGAYNQVKAHMSTLKKRCSDDEGACLYKRGESKCAIGALLPKSLLDLAANVSGGIATLERYHPIIRDFFDGCNGDLLADLQNAHDDQQHWTDEGFVIGYVEDVARKYGLLA